MNFDLIHIWASMGVLSKTIAAVLLLMAIGSIGVVIERLWAFSKSRRLARSFAPKAAISIEEWNLDELIALSDSHKGSALAQLFGATAKRYQASLLRDDIATSAGAMARKESERSLESIGGNLRQGMSLLASVGSVAPFVGLLGTVVGIIGAFQGIAASGSGGLGAVSVGIAEALVETALGLMVAIPAVLFFNYLSTRINSIEAALSRSIGELLDEMEARNGRPSDVELRLAA